MSSEPAPYGFLNPYIIKHCMRSYSSASKFKHLEIPAPPKYSWAVTKNFVRLWHCGFQIYENKSKPMVYVTNISGIDEFIDLQTYIMRYIKPVEVRPIYSIHMWENDFIRYALYRIQTYFLTGCFIDSDAYEYEICEDSILELPWYVVDVITSTPFGDDGEIHCDHSSYITSDDELVSITINQDDDHIYTICDGSGCVCTSYYDSVHEPKLIVHNVERFWDVYKRLIREVQNF